MRITRSRYPAPPVTLASGVTLEADESVHRGLSTATDAPVALRLQVFVSRRKLDRQIADGSRYEATDALALRVRQLIDDGNRRRVASELRGVVEWVDHRESSPFISSVMLDRAAVRAGREAILGLAERIEAPTPASARGMVLARALITDGLSPLYNPLSERTVADAVFEVQDALGAQPPAVGLDALAV